MVLLVLFLNFAIITTLVRVIGVFGLHVDSEVEEN